MFILAIIGLFSLVAGAPREKRQDESYFMENKCSMAARNSSCPAGYCCAYDEFFRIIYYCKKLGAVGESCSTVSSDADCPCEPGLACVPTVQGSSFVTIYGRCQVKSQPTTAAMTTDGPVTSDGAVTTYSPTGNPTDNKGHNSPHVTHKPHQG
ncbi:uncharacterized protein LOC133204219 [Saccostrea echinata]|uniref:uncharacterized protein LOC133204219 n=1 Tax=Saccostrea echinata TaxID=191078 RepID=UPI002A835F53|nr:uncharacterized protein LOC133204219 [Saccostrea echinata]